MKLLFRLLLCVVAFLIFSCRSARNTGPHLNHIALYTQYLPRSTNFYRDLVGLDTIPEPFHDGKHTWFRIGAGAALHLIEGAGGPVVQNKNTHLCFSVRSLDGLIANLRTGGVPFEDWAGKPNSITTRVDGVHQIYFRDPDGHWIEVNDAR